MVEVEIEMHNEASCWKVIFPKGHVPQYMISRVFIPPWSLVMRGRKLLDQTLPPRRKKAGTLVFLLERFFVDPIVLPYQSQGI
jgi:hypothetical protein